MYLTDYMFILIWFVVNIVILGIFHFIADWLFQRDHRAVKKINDWKARLIHSVVYSYFIFIGIVLINFYFLQEMLLIEGILIYLWFVLTHFLLDDRKFVKWWFKRIKGGNEDNPLMIMFSIMLDQIFHFLVMIPSVFYIILRGMGII